MNAVYSGHISREGYLFITNNVFGTAENESAIVRVNNCCGAFIVTAQGDTLIKVRSLLDSLLPTIAYRGEGLSMELAMAISDSFKREFQKGSSFRENPLPFLLLLIGYNLKNHPSLDYIFMRNRVVKIEERAGKREYVTDMEIKSPVPARNLFYGHSGLPQYLSQELPSEGLDLETMKLFVYFSMYEIQKIDKSLCPNVRMAIISEDNGFNWVKGEEIQKLSLLAKKVDVILSEGLLNSFVVKRD